MKSNDLSIIHERMAVKAVEVNHFHHHAQQFFFVLFATATFDIAEERIVLQKNALDGRKYSRAHKYKGDLLRPNLLLK